MTRIIEMRVTLIIALALCSSTSLRAEEIIPSEAQTTLLRGTLEQSEDIRIVSGEPDSTGHGPITYYRVPFTEGAFSATWKVEVDQAVLFVFDGPTRGKASHLLKVYVNGGPGGKNRNDVLTLITYDGSTTAKKNASVVREEYHATPGEWHDISVSFSGNTATVIIDGKEFVATSARFSEGIEKTGVGHFTGSLLTKEVKITK